MSSNDSAARLGAAPVGENLASSLDPSPCSQTLAPSRTRGAVHPPQNMDRNIETDRVEAEPSAARASHGHPASSKTLFLRKVPDDATDDSLFRDFSAYGRVLATKVYTHQGSKQLSSGKVKGAGRGAFVEFACRDAALQVINTMTEYRGRPVDIKWGTRSLVDSIKEKKRQEQKASSRDGAEDEGGEHDITQDGRLPTFGTVYDEPTVVYDANPIDAFIQRQAFLWHQQLKAHYAAVSRQHPGRLPPAAPPAGQPPGPPPPPPGPPAVQLTNFHMHMHHGTAYPVGIPVPSAPPPHMIPAEYILHPGAWY